MKYVKLYKFPKTTPNNSISGVFCADKLENIEWYKQDLTSTEGGNDYFYQISGSYYGSSLDKDFELNITNLFDEGISALYPEEADRVKIMNFFVNSIVEGCQRTLTTPGNTVVDVYPPFPINTSLVIDSDPFASSNVAENPGEGFEKGGEAFGPGAEFG
tara:strand:+ start:825 stop:1301 length:477 start_codon:yes stop_codon:yes gene_type:complete